MVIVGTPSDLKLRNVTHELSVLTHVLAENSIFVRICTSWPWITVQLLQLLQHQFH